MARVVAFIPDLLFGSRVQGDLSAGGHTVDLVGQESAARRVLADADVLVIDLTDEPARRADLLNDLLKSLPREDASKLRTLAFYSHVDVDARRLAEAAGFDLIVPRSRMAREGAALVSQLVRAVD